MSVLKIKKIHPYVVISLLIIMISSLPFLGGMVFQGHDTCFHTQRIESIAQELLSGNFPVRIYHDMHGGYGYGASLFYPELFLYIPAVLFASGLSLIRSYNLFIVLINICTMVSAFISFSKITSSKSIGMISATFYLLSTYRLVDMCARGSLGELLSLIFCPLALYGLVCLKNKENDKWPVLAVAFSGLLQSHILTFVMMCLVALFFIIVHIRCMLNKTTLLVLMKAVISAVVLNAWFLFPFLEAMSIPVKVSVLSDSIWQTSAFLTQLFDITLLEPIGTELYSAQIAGSVAKTPGALLLLCSLLFPVISCAHRHTNLKTEMMVFFLFGMIGVWMTTNLFPWEILIKIDFIKVFIEKFQFLFRFNVIGILFLSLTAGYCVSVLWMKENRKLEFVLLMCGIISVSALVYLNGFVQKARQMDEWMLMEEGFMDDLYVMDEHDIFSVYGPLSKSQNIVFKNVVRGNSESYFDFEIIQPSEIWVEVPMIYYPGYVAEINGQKVNTELSNRGVVSFQIPDSISQGHVHVYYEQSIACRVGNTISLLGLLIGMLSGLKRIKVN